MLFFQPGSATAEHYDPTNIYEVRANWRNHPAGLAIKADISDHRKHFGNLPTAEKFKQMECQYACLILGMDGRCLKW